MNNNIIVKAYQKAVKNREASFSKGDLKDYIYAEGAEKALRELVTSESLFYSTKEQLRSFLNSLYTINSETTTEEELQDYYDNANIEVNFKDHALLLPFSAELYHSLVYLVETACKEYGV